jgi:hypothetical protein
MLKALEINEDHSENSSGYILYWILMGKIYSFLIRAKIFALELKRDLIDDERGDVPGWVLVVLMTTGLITAIWAIAEPRLSQLLRSSLDSMNSVR